MSMRDLLPVTDCKSVGRTGPNNNNDAGMKKHRDSDETNVFRPSPSGDTTPSVTRVPFEVAG